MVEIVVNGKKMQVEQGIKLGEIVRMTEPYKNPPLVARLNNEIIELNVGVERAANIDFEDYTTTDGFRVYQRSVVFVMILAAREILGRHVRVVVEHSINKNFYCEIFEDDLCISQEILDQIEAKMREIVVADMPIEKHKFSLSDGIELAKQMHLPDKVRLLNYRTSSSVNFYKLDWLYDYFYGPMASSTGHLSEFSLSPSDDSKGFMLNFGSRKDSELSSGKISRVFRESNAWARILEIDTVGSLNDKIAAGGSGDIIRINEALHEKSVATIADEIYEKGRRIVLIAGPSSSGKTTFSKRLCVQLQVNGLKPHIIGLDNYYVDREKTPVDEFGKPDFESLYAIDIARLNEDMKNLLLGKSVNIPKFNFLTGKREYKSNYIHLDKDDVLVIEGIHGLNPRLFPDISIDFANNAYKIFISALTQLNLDDHNRIPAADTRKIRRMVRDNQFRGFDARSTIAMWPSVTRGESENIFPYQEEADYVFNSALVYEMCVLKTHAMPLLFGIKREEEGFVEARRLLKFLDCFMAIAEREVPNNSLLREFIGGGCFVVH